MYANLNNECRFTGRIAKDVEIQHIPGRNGEMFTKVNFSLAIDRGMTTAQRENAKSRNEPTADFISCTMSGKRAEGIANFFPKGKPITVSAVYRSYSYDKKDGSGKAYGHVFEITDYTFVPKDTTDVQNNGGNNYNNGMNNGMYNNTPFNNGQPMMGQSDNFGMLVEDSEMPF